MESVIGTNVLPKAELEYLRNAPTADLNSSTTGKRVGAGKASSTTVVGTLRKRSCVNDDAA